jgi:hypothetical protein
MQDYVARLHFAAHHVIAYRHSVISSGILTDLPVQPTCIDVDEGTSLDSRTQERGL